MENSQSWRAVSTATLMSGFAYGCRAMTVRVTVSGGALTAKQMQDVTSWLSQNSGINPDSADAMPVFHDSHEFFLHTICSVQKFLDFPITETGICQPLAAGEARLFIPVFRGAFASLVRLVEFVLELFNAARTQSLARIPGAGLHRICKDLQRFTPSTGNVRAFMAAADMAGIPVHRLPGNAVVYGQGKRARLLESSFTDKTSIIASQQARNKPVASEILRQYGLPVPVHQVVQDVRSAVQAAEKIGYPVVVKPVDRDRGDGVSANLQTKAQVETACQQAFSYSKNVMVEKHFHGKDHRITVVDGRVVWAVERVPGGVTGDGKHSVTELLAMVNSDPERSDHSRSPLKKIVLDDEARDLLQQYGMTPGSVPEKEHFVVLRRSSNVTKGGVPRAVFDKIHPDNCRLAERAAQVLRLDIAGVDLLIPDISKSWRESGAAICEVNAQPTIGTYTAGHLYGMILQHLLQGNGRIPVVLVVGSDCAGISRQAAAAMSQAGYTCGLYDGESTTINGAPVEASMPDAFSAGRMLAMDPTVDAVVVAITDDTIVTRGLPLQRFDILITTADVDGHAELLDMMLPACDGAVMNIAEDDRLSDRCAGLSVVTYTVFNSDGLLQLLTECRALKQDK